MYAWSRRLMPRSLFSRPLARRSRIAVGASTDIGYVRRNNEDAYGVFTGGARDGERLFMVADGMGGFERGADASALAVDTIRRIFFEHEGAAESRFTTAFVGANRAIYDRATSKNVRMGTTCTALAYGGGLVVSHVGDSRAYRVTAHTIDRLTEDHTLAESLRTQGVLTRSEAEMHPGGSALTRALGVGPEVEPTVVRLDDPAETTWYVLCTDGLKSVDVERVGALVRKLEPQLAAEALVGEANQAGGSDNTTVVVVRVG